MTLKEKAIEMFGENYFQECPAKVFGMMCWANNDYPFCSSKGCWDFHNADKINYNDNNENGGNGL